MAIFENSVNIGNDLSANSGLVSVIVPLYNSATSICRCIDSIFKQSYGNVEIIVIDDGSTDNSLDAISRYGGKIILLKQQNKGPAAARNAGIKISKGKYIAFLDSDDYWLPVFLEKCVAVLNRFPQAVAVSTAAKAIHWTSEEVSIPSFINTKECLAFTDGNIISDFFGFWAREDHIRTGSVVINTHLLPELLFQREDLRISEDLEYWGMLATYADWAFLPEVLFVTDGTSNAAASGWLEKNRERRKQCPTVESWQKRIESRLKKDDLNAFNKMRGRIAGNFAHSKILAGDFNEAVNIVNKYGDSFRSGAITGLMQKGARLGPLIWCLCCIFIQAREMLKAFYITSKYRLRSK